MENNILRNAGGFLRRWGECCCMYTKSFLTLVLSFCILQSNAQTITIDGNPADWPAVLSSGTIVAKTFKHDANNTNDDQFTGGSQDPDLISEWSWVLGNTNDKGDISNAGAALIGTNLYFFGDRTAINGDAQIGFWFFLGGVAPSGTGASNSPFSGQHVVGDLLVLSNFTNGGGTVTLRIYEWVGSGGSDGSLDFLGTTTNAAVNSADYPVPVYPNWTYTPKFGTGYVTGSFFEGFIDISTLASDICFSSFLLETRNSQSTDASLQDFAAGSFNLKPLNPTVTPASRCGEGTVTLTASCSSSGSIVRWWAAASGGSPLQTGSPFTPTVSSTTTFYASCFNADLNCESDRVPVVATVFPIPPAPTTTGASRCGPGEVSLSASGCNGTLKWYAAASGGSPIFTGSPYVVNLSATTTFYVSCTSGDNCEGPRAPVTGTIFDIPAAPTTTGASRCGPGEVSLSASGCNGTLKWYANASGDSPVFTGSPYVVNLSATTTFYVSCTSADNCEGPRAPVTGTIFTIPAAPTTTGASRCGPGEVSLSASGCNGTLKWYAAASGGSPIFTGSPYVVNLSATTTFYVSCTSADNCEGPRAPVTGTIFEVPAAPTTTGASRCGPGEVSLSASGCDGTLKWYAAASGGSPIFTGSPYVVNLSATTTFYVSCTSADNCEGPRAPVTGTIFVIPAAPTTTGASRCGPGEVSLSASGCNGTLKWYAAASGGSPIFTGSPYVVNLSATTTFYVSCTSGDNCEGPRAPVTGTIFTIPAAPTTTGASRCGPGEVSLSASGCNGTLKWYAAASGGSPIFTGSPYVVNLSATTTFYVSCTSADNCEGPRAPVTGTIFTIPAAPTTTGASRCGPGEVSLSASGCNGTLKWYAAASGGSPIFTGSPYVVNLSATTTFYVSCTSADNCEGPRAPVTGTIFDIPPAPTTTGASRCGPGEVSLSASGCDGTLRWYAAASGGSPIFTGSPYVVNLSATTTFYVSCFSGENCEGPRSPVTGTIFVIPGAPTTTGASRCGPGEVSLSASGCDGTLKWYAAASGGSPIFTGSPYVVNLSATTTFYVSCTSADNCEGPRAPVTGTVFPIPTVTADDKEVCEGSTDLITLTGSPGGGVFTGDHVTNGLFDPTGLAAGDYPFTYTFTDGNGCTNGDQGIVTIHPLPSVILAEGAGSTNLVKQLEATISGGTAPYDFVWSSDPANGIIYTGPVNGQTNSLLLTNGAQLQVPSPVAIIDITDANGCPARSDLQLAIEVPCAITGETEVCAGETFNYSITDPVVLPGLKYQWEIINNTANAEFAGGGTTAEGTSVTVNTGGVGGFTLQVTVCFDDPQTPEEVCEPVELAEPCILDVTVISCVENCSYTQGYYGNQNGNSCDNGTVFGTPVDLIYHLLQQGGDITVGRAGRSVIIPATMAGAIKLNSVMPGGQSPKILKPGDCNILDACFNAYLTSQGRINNVLLSQTIALSLNVRLNGGQLATFELHNGWLTTQDLDGCGDVPVVSCEADPNAISSILLNANVVNYLTNNGANTATVADLLDLANDVLGGTKTPGVNGVPSFGDINSAVDAINRAFDQCRAFVGYFDVQQFCPPLIVLANRSPLATEAIGANGNLSVSAYPNPFTDEVKFVIHSRVSGYASLEVFNVLGQKIRTLFQGHLTKGFGKTVEFAVPLAEQTMLIYVVRMNDQRVTGKLMHIR